MRLNAQLDVVADRAQLQVTLERFESRFDLAQLHVSYPERPCLVAGIKAAQQVMAVALLGILEFVLEQLELEGVAIDGLARLGQGDFHKPPGLAGLLVRGAQLVQEGVAFPGPLAGAPPPPPRAQEPSPLSPAGGRVLFSAGLPPG